MSFEINPKTMQSLNLSTDLTKPIKNNNLNSSVWEVYSQYDKNGNNELSSSELASLVKDIKKYNGNVTVLAKVWNLKIDKNSYDEEKARNVINKTSGDILASELYDVLNPNVLFGIRKGNYAKDLVKQINKDNVAEVLNSYKEVISVKKGFFNDLVGNTRKGANLFTHIAAGLESESVTKELYLYLADILKEAADEKGINIKTLWNDWQNSVKANKWDMLALDEIATRLQMDYAQDVLIESQKAEIAEKNKKLKDGSIMLDQDNEQHEILKSKAEKVKIKYNSNHQEGNNVIGDTKSVGGNQNSQKILNAINNLLKDPVMAEKFDAVYKKDGDVCAMYFPGIVDSNKNSDNFTENQVAQTLINRGNGVYGDGDMSALVLTLINYFKHEHIDVSKTSQKKLETIIKEMVDPRIEK